MRQVFYSYGAMVDAIDHVEWENSKDGLRELRMHVIIIEGWPRGRGTQTCEVQNMPGGFYVWLTGTSIK